MTRGLGHVGFSGWRRGNHCELGRPLLFLQFTVFNFQLISFSLSDPLLNLASQRPFFTFIRSFSKVIRSLCLVLEMCSGKEDVCALKDIKNVYKKEEEKA